jgi:hypothetical protein
MYHNFYASAVIFKMIKSRGMTWAGNVERIDEVRNAYKFCSEKPEEKNTWKANAWIEG